MTKDAIAQRIHTQLTSELKSGSIRRFLDQLQKAEDEQELMEQIHSNYKFYGTSARVQTQMRRNLQPLLDLTADGWPDLEDNEAWASVRSLAKHAVKMRNEQLRRAMFFEADADKSQLIEYEAAKEVARSLNRIISMINDSLEADGQKPVDTNLTMGDMGMNW